jgi:hypothetical protein
MNAAALRAAANAHDSNADRLEGDIDATDLEGRARAVALDRFVASRRRAASALRQAAAAVEAIPALGLARGSSTE